MSEIYLPTYTKNLKDQEFPLVWLGLQGPSGTGKTYSALTFPNPLVLNYDKGLTAWAGKDVQEIPFWNEDFVATVLKCPKSKPSAMTVNKKQALLKFLSEERTKFKPNQTLILDSWSAIQDAFDMETALYPKITQKGDEDTYDFWAKKLDYANEVYELLRGCNCHIVITFHEIQARDPKTGASLEKVKPLMQGQFQQKIKIPFSDFYRTVTEEKKNSKGQVTGCDFFWQVKSDNNFDAKCRLDIPDEVIRVEPHFKIFQQYKAKK